MKKTLFSWAVLISFCATAQQPTVETTPFTIVERGDHHRVWQSVTTETTDEGKTVYRTNSFIELETGMNVRQPDGSYIEANPEIQITAEGATAQNTRHSINFVANCNTSIAIDLVSADGKQFQSHVIGLSYLDRASGQVVMIAEIKDSIGQLLPSKTEVVYPDAMTDFHVDLTYQNSKSGMEQNVILVGRPPTPVCIT